MGVGAMMMDSLCNNAATKRASWRLGQFYDEMLAPCGLRATQYALVDQIARLGAPSLTDLAQALVLDRSALSHTLRPLERDRLVALRANDADRRVKRVALTPLGEDRLAHGAALWAGAQSCFEASFGATEAARLRATLDRLASLTLCAKKAWLWDERIVRFDGRPPHSP